MRMVMAWTLGLLACDGGGEADDGTTPPDPPPEDTATETHGTTDTGGGNAVFIPRYVNIDAAFGVDATGAVVPVVSEYYKDPVAPTITLYIGSEDWTPGDWGSDQVCVVVLDITGATPGAWVKEEGMWFGFDTPVGAPAIYSACEDMQGDGYDPYAFASAIQWSVGVGELVPPYATYYSTYEDTFGGFSATPADPEPDDDEGRAMVGVAYPLDAYGAVDYAATMPATAIPNQTGPGIAPGYYFMTSWWILELP